MTWKIDAQEAAAARGRLHGARTVLMPTHQNVDADGLSSPIAMRDESCGARRVLSSLMIFSFPL